MIYSVLVLLTKLTNSYWKPTGVAEWMLDMRKVCGSAPGPFEDPLRATPVRFGCDIFRTSEVF